VAKLSFFSRIRVSSWQQAAVGGVCDDTECSSDEAHDDNVVVFWFELM